MATQSSLNAHKQEMDPEPGLETMPKRFQDETSPRLRNLGPDQQQSQQPERLGDPLLQPEISNKDNPAMALMMRELSLNQQRMPPEEQNEVPGKSIMSKQGGNLVPQLTKRSGVPPTPLDPSAVIAFMDAMDVPGAAISQISSQIPQPPPTIKKWGELKQWLIKINANPSAQRNALSLQQFHSLKLLSRSPAQNPGGDQLPPGVQPLDPEESNRNAALDNDLRNVTVVPEEIQNARLTNQKFNGWPDEHVWSYLVQVKQYQIKKNYMPRPPKQQPAPNQPDQSG